MSAHPINLEDAKKYGYRFWKNKPMMKFDNVYIDTHKLKYN